MNVNMAENQLNTSSLPFRNFFINSYILPGFLFVITTILICSIFKEQLPNWVALKKIDFTNELTQKSILNLLTKEFSLFAQIIFLLIVIFTSIIVGNALSVFGSLLFDLTWLGKGIGWPYERILSYYPKNYLGRAIIISLFTILNIICVIQIYNPFDSYGTISIILFLIFVLKFIPKWYFSLIYGTDKKLRNLPLFILKNVKNTIILTDLFDKSNKNLREFLREITEGKRSTLFETKWLLWSYLNKKKRYGRTKTTIIWVLSLSFILDISVFIAIFFGKYFGISHGLNKYSRKAFIEKMNRISPQQVVKNNTGIYWNTYISMINKDPENIRIANSHLKRSILIRNLSVVGVIILFFLINLQPTDLNSDNFERWQYWSFNWWLSSFLLFVGYNIIIYKYYTKYLIRCFILENAESTTHNNV